MPVAHRIIVYGDVQGVGLRWNIRQYCQQEGIRGHVRNKPSGSVEIMCQGTTEQIKRLVEFLKKSPNGSRVQEVEHSTGNTSVSFISFSIKMS